MTEYYRTTMNFQLDNTIKFERLKNETDFKERLGGEQPSLRSPLGDSN